MLPLVPTNGTLVAQIFESKFLGIVPSVIFKIEVPIVPFKFEDEVQKTSLVVEFIRLPVTTWREVFDREFTFAVNPEPGYIHGSRSLGSVHNPVDTSRIRFSPPEGALLPVSIEFSIDFTFEGLDELGKPEFTWETKLSFSASNLDSVFGQARSLGIPRSREREAVSRNAA